MRHGIGWLFLAAGLVVWRGPATAAERVENVSFAVHGEQVYVTYDLTGRGPYEVELWLSEDGGRTVSFQAQTVTGAVGRDVAGGRGRTIRWEARRDRPQGLVGDQYVFEVRARRHAGRTQRLVVGLAVGTAAAAGVVAVSTVAGGGGDAARGTLVVIVPDPQP